MFSACKKQICDTFAKTKYPIFQQWRNDRTYSMHSNTHELAYHKYRQRKDRSTHPAIGLLGDLRAIGPTKDYFDFLRTGIDHCLGKTET